MHVGWGQKNGRGREHIDGENIKKGGLDVCVGSLRAQRGTMDGNERVKRSLRSCRDGIDKKADRKKSRGIEMGTR